MNTTEQVLLIILASALAVFLVLSIVIAVKTIQIMNHLKRLTEKAEGIADKAEAVTSFFQASAGPVAITKLVANIVSTINAKHNKSKE